MLHEVFASEAEFRSIYFRPGLNVITAARDSDSGERDSRNGAGKSTLLEIVHFCLGSSLDKSPLNNVDLSKWSFGLGFTLPFSGRYEIERAISKPQSISIKTAPETKTNQVVSTKNWTDLLGEKAFPLGEPNANLSFRSLFPYFARRGVDAYTSPFDLVRKQSLGPVRVRVAYLLGLNWMDFQALEGFDSELKGLTEKRKALGASDGALNAERLKLEAKVRKERDALENFKVHPQYQEMERVASEVTSQIGHLSEDIILLKERIDRYRDAIAQEVDSTSLDVEKIFSEAQLVFSEHVKKNLQQSREFHRQVIENRRKYLEREIREDEHRLQEMESKRSSLIESRADILSILRTHGALQAYQRLSEQHSKLNEELVIVNHQLGQLRQLEAEIAELKRKDSDLQERTNHNFQEMGTHRDEAVALFSEFADELYEDGGTLLLELDSRARLKFDAYFKNDSSQSVGAMKVFCFDLVVASLWARKELGPGFLFHDSMIFDGVDERQKARALKIAERVSRENGFQYVCTINTDQIPWGEFETGFDLNAYIIRELNDDGPSGKLLGRQFESRAKPGQVTKSSALNAQG